MPDAGAAREYLDPRVRSIGPRARAVDLPGGGGERERPDLSLTSPHLTTSRHHRARRALRVSERQLVRWLRAVLNTAGAEDMVRRFGARRVLDALYTDVLCEEPVVETESFVNEHGRCRVRQVEVGRRRVPREDLRSPGGFLRWILQLQDGRDGP